MPGGSKHRSVTAHREWVMHTVRMLLEFNYNYTCNTVYFDMHTAQSATANARLSVSPPGCLPKK